MAQILGDTTWKPEYETNIVRSGMKRRRYKGEVQYEKKNIHTSHMQNAWWSKNKNEHLIMKRMRHRRMGKKGRRFSTYSVWTIDLGDDDALRAVRCVSYARKPAGRLNARTQRTSNQHPTIPSTYPSHSWSPLITTAI